MNEELLKKLEEIYILVGYGHKELRPWGEFLQKWQKEVEKETGWNYFEQFEKQNNH